MTTDIQQTVISKIRKSPAYSVMPDEATDVSNRKHLEFVANYINYYKDAQIENGLAVTVFNEIRSNQNRECLLVYAFWVKVEML